MSAKSGLATSEAREINLNKVPEVTIAFWVIKIFATTLGETAGDAVTMTLHLGYAVGTAIFFTLFVGTVAAQVRARSFHPLLYWAVIVATTTVGTTIGGLCGPLARNQLRRRFDHSVRAADGGARTVAICGGFGFG